MQAATTPTTSRRWFWPAVAYTAAWVACLVAAEWLVAELMQGRIDAACDSPAQQDTFFCGIDEELDRLFVVVIVYLAVVLLGLLVLSWIRRRRLPTLRPAWIVSFVTVFGQVMAGMVGWALAALVRDATIVWAIWGLLWLAAPMLGMRLWLLSGEPAAA